MSTQQSTQERDADQWADTHGDLASGEGPAKRRRIRLACRRCQKRKIKCDGNIPKCNHCQQAGTECIDGRKTGSEGSISRREAAALHEYIQSLETTLRNYAPGIELSNLNSTRSSELPSSRGVTEAGAGGESNNNIWQDDVVRTNSTPSPDRSRENQGRDNLNPNSSQRTRPTSRDEIAHDIGLVPLSSGVNKYVGPSSGFTLTKLIFKSAGRSNLTGGNNSSTNEMLPESSSTTTSRMLLAIQPAALPTSLTQAIQLSRIYFEHVHIQYPFLHEPTFFDMLRVVYEDSTHAPKWAKFQVTMVLAVSASILSKRLPIPFSGESLCTSAIQDMEEIDMQGSVEGLQCFLLLYMFTLHSPFSRVSPWHLNYQCLAAVLDLGLQRDLASSPTVSTFEREMRTRIFWVIYSIDRVLATTLGRPIGIRDEACDLRQPIGTDDSELRNPRLAATRQSEQRPTIRQGPMACATILFRLAQLNSEIKYVLHSLSHVTPRYTYPQITDIIAWQNDVWERLQECSADGPNFTDERRYLTSICAIRYNEVVMHLFRPTPRIRTPTKENLLRCRESAERTIALWKELYEADRMSYSWVMIHSVCLSALTILYCIWTSPEIAASTHVDKFTSIIRDASTLLSAAGEYWIEARRSRGRLDGLADATVRWLTDKLKSRTSPQKRQNASRSARRSQVVDPSSASAGGQSQGQGQGLDTARQSSQAQIQFSPSNDPFSQDAAAMAGGNPAQYPDVFDYASEQDLNTYISNEDLASFLGAPNAFVSSDDNFLMQGMFSEYQPLFEFNGIDSGMNCFF